MVLKKVLVTGAAGAIGLNVIKYLLSEGKFEITAIDLKNKRSIQKLKRYKKRINLVYGDVTDRTLVENLVKDQDIVIHLAGVLPPLGSIKKDLAQIIDFGSTENITRAISYYNPKCHLFYASSTSLYCGRKDVSVKSNISLNKDDYYNIAKLDSENLIKEKLKNYTIYRLPLVLGDLISDDMPLNGKLSEDIEYITKEDAAYAFVKGINKKDEINKKIFNVTSGNDLLYKNLIIKYLETIGFSWHFVVNRLFAEKDFYNASCKDNDALNDIIDYRTDNLDNYYKRLNKNANRRHISITVAKPLVKVLKK